MQRVAILNYGMGNIRSVFNAIEAVGGAADIVSDPEAVSSYDKAILPGVGAFSKACEHLHDTGMWQSLNEFKNSGKPVLGICLGMQLMCSLSHEGGQHEGLNWVKAKVLPLPKAKGIKVPHIGWNALEIKQEHPWATPANNGSDLYFVHSYYVECDDKDDVVTTCHYGVDFVATFAHDNLVGMQYHPEKSQHIGLAMLKGFVEC